MDVEHVAISAPTCPQPDDDDVPSSSARRRLFARGAQDAAPTRSVGRAWRARQWRDRDRDRGCERCRERPVDQPARERRADHDEAELPAGPEQHRHDRRRQHEQALKQHAAETTSVGRRRCARTTPEPLDRHGLAPRSEIRDRVVHLFQRVGLSADQIQRHPHEFSGGQRQRICVARALALSPKAIVADESVSSLDVSVQALVLNLLQELQAELGIAYLFITHDMAVVEKISHRVAVMYFGQIVEMGTRAQVFEDPRHAYTRRLLQSVPIPDLSLSTDAAVDFWKAKFRTRSNRSAMFQSEYRFGTSAMDTWLLSSRLPAS